MPLEPLVHVPESKAMKSFPPALAHFHLQQFSPAVGLTLRYDTLLNKRLQVGTHCRLVLLSHFFTQLIRRDSLLGGNCLQRFPVCPSFFNMVATLTPKSSACFSNIACYR